MSALVISVIKRAKTAWRKCPILLLAWRKELFSLVKIAPDHNQMSC